jgi:hypothetical protein
MGVGLEDWVLIENGRRERVEGGGAVFVCGKKNLQKFADFKFSRYICTRNHTENRMNMSSSISSGSRKVSPVMGGCYPPPPP